MLPARPLLTRRRHWRNPRRVRRTASGRSVYNYFRDYVPSLGRYTQADPIGLSGGSLSTYAYAGGNPVVTTDPTGLSIAGDITKLWRWLNPSPLSEEECRNLRDDIYRKNGSLRNELDAYDPILDGQGGFTMAYGSGVTKPGGHYKEIRNLQRGLKNDLARYNQRCRCDADNNNPPITRNVDELANKPVPPPISPLFFYPSFAPGSGVGVPSGVLVPGLVVP